MSAQNRVMFVDDEEGVRVSWNRFLSERGFDVTTANDGRQAIDRLREEPVDVVVSDLKMPGVDGVKLLEWIHERRPETRFILLTGYGNEVVERKVRELGAFDYLNKPISPDQLAAVVTAAMHLKLLEPEAVPAAQGAVAEATETAAEAPAEASRVHKTGARRALEVAGGLIAAPLLGLAFVIFLPIVGFAALVWALARPIWQAVRSTAG